MTDTQITDRLDALDETAAELDERIEKLEGAMAELRALLLGAVSKQVSAALDVQKLQIDSRSADRGRRP